ncbi:MAG: HNH endonuclease [Steroidobacter sp.]
MVDRAGWTQKQLLVAFALYCQIPFGKMHSRNPEIIRYAQAIGRSPGALAMKLTNIASLDPMITQSGRKGLPGASAADRNMWTEMQSDWKGFAVRSQAILRNLGLGNIDNSSDENAESEFDYQGKNKRTLVNVRIGQNFFRKTILSAYKSQCCISGLTITNLLVASHIIPWRNDPKNRLNPRNGLCLSVLHDRAFDLGLITISKNFTVQVSRKIAKKKDGFLQSALFKYVNTRIQLPDKFQPEESFLEYHRKHIFESL